jgi:hypothetical protein
MWISIQIICIWDIKRSSASRQIEPDDVEPETVRIEVKVAPGFHSFRTVLISTVGFLSDSLPVSPS